MNAILLTEKPESGALPERSWAAASRPNLWVRFETPAPWIGVFAPGMAHFSALRWFGAGACDDVLVIAGGQGYIVDTSNQAVRRTISWDYLWSAASVPDAEFIVVADNTRVWLTHREREVPTTARPGGTTWPGEPEDQLAMDGIVLDAVCRTEVTGFAWWLDGWRKFRLDLTDRQFEVDAVTDSPPGESEFGGTGSPRAGGGHGRGYLLW